MDTWNIMKIVFGIKIFDDLKIFTCIFLKTDLVYLSVMTQHCTFEGMQAKN